MNKKLIFALGLATVAAGANANLLVNGGFEDTGGAAVQVWGGYTYGSGYSPVLPGWTVDFGNVDIVPQSISSSTWSPAQTPPNSLDLVGFQAGGISQTFNTVAGSQYSLSFFYSKNVAGSPDPSTAKVSLSGTTGFTGANISVSSIDDGSPGAMNWLPFAPVNFTATGTTVKLTFAATNAANAGGVFIDSVSVVPEPEAYGLALAGMGVVAFAMRRRQLKSS